jgi:hypothetical protein
MSYRLADGSLSTDYTEGDLFVGGFVGAEGETPQFLSGSIVRLDRDDTTHCPYFELIEGFFEPNTCAVGDYIYEDWACLKKHTVKEQDPEVTIRQSEVDAYIDEINMLRELVAEITLQSDFNSLEQQAEAFRVLNDKMLSHQSYKQGDGGSTRIGELSKQLDVLFAAYDSLAGKQKEQTFKPVSEMTLEDWQQALEEGWEFLDNYGDINTVTEITDLVFFSEYCYGFSIDGKHSIDSENNFIVKRIK